MTEAPATPTPTPPEPAPDDRPRRQPMEVPTETREEIVRLHAHYGSREIARRLNPRLSRKVVQRILREEGCSESDPRSPKKKPSRLSPFTAQIEDLVDKGLTVTRILREIRAVGYDGGRTILAKRVEKLRVQKALLPKKQVKRRFETRPGEEMQIDWSPYTLSIAGRPTKAHAFGCLLCASRKLFLAFFKDERQPTLLEALARALEYFEGSALRVVLDNMATAVLGRIGSDNKPQWHPRFLDFARHYGFEPYACAVRDPDRKGKKEKSFRLVEDDHLKGVEFSSWEDLEHKTKVWLDETPDVGNLRIHGTTRQVPNEAWLSERELLIQLPEKRFPVHEDSVRLVDLDSTVSIRGTPYSVPSVLAGRSVAVRLYAEHFEVLDPQGRIAFSRRYVPDAEKGKLVIDPTHYATMKRRPRGGGGERLDEAFIKRFPELAPFVEGLKLRMKSLAPIHLRAMLRQVDGYGEEAFLAAAKRALEYRRFAAQAVERILERDYPLLELDPVAPLGGVGATVLGEVEPGTLDGYGRLDGTPSTGDHGDDEEGGSHGA